ncbi:putative LRR receptor-like serine/threonine-protein kinase [Acorus calamus]|uniref:LRR receptor-like serine/threonine-protein kinase n=1 Tax=Acorus calamus TaxID=4465 RepID=A0AAV9F8Q0_ACOCL|nr:putative LRR receptor-like serine/threonine-protein kinase [Acorus calamus]
MKNSLSGGSISSWTPDIPYCDYPGVACDESGNVIKMDVSEWSLSGTFPPDVCVYLPALRVLRLAENNFQGGFPSGISNCSLLEELNLSSTNFGGAVPNLSGLKYLRLLDMSYNLFSGSSPYPSSTSPISRRSTSMRTLILMPGNCPKSSRGSQG